MATTFLVGWERAGRGSWDLTWVLQPRAGPDAAGPCGAFSLSHSRKPQLLALFFPGPDAILQLPHCALKSIQLLNLSSFMCLPSTEAPGLSPSLLLLLEGCGFFPQFIFVVGFCCFLSILQLWFHIPPGAGSLLTPSSLPIRGEAKPTCLSGLIPSSAYTVPASPPALPDKHGSPGAIPSLGTPRQGHSAHFASCNKCPSWSRGIADVPGLRSQVEQGKPPR